MSDYNRTILVGRMVRDPELKYTASGVAVVNFSIAVNRPFKGKDGEKEVDFIDIVAWRQSAEFAANYLSKGRLVLAEGRIQVRSYDDKDGNRRKAVEVVADQLRGMDKPKEGAERKDNAAHDNAGVDEAFDDPFQDE